MAEREEIQSAAALQEKAHLASTVGAMKTSGKTARSRIEMDVSDGVIAIQATSLAALRHPRSFR